jgi:hypothetical protein
MAGRTLISHRMYSSWYSLSSFADRPGEQLGVMFSFTQHKRSEGNQQQRFSFQMTCPIDHRFPSTPPITDLESVRVFQS